MCSMALYDWHFFWLNFFLNGDFQTDPKEDLTEQYSSKLFEPALRFIDSQMILLHLTL